MKIEVRPAGEEDRLAISRLVLAAFGSEQGPQIDSLVSALLVDPTARPVVSLVAVEDGSVVGHLLFTAVKLDGSSDGQSAAILAPLCVDPTHQCQGIGGRLIEDGLERLARMGIELVFVLGHPDYYPRHGFVPAGVLGFDAPHAILPEHAEAWMVRELRPGAASGRRCCVVCADALNAPEHWRE